MLEVIATSISDAIAAEQGGASRIELITRFDVGGLTPSLGLVRDVLQYVKIPVRVMLRESEDFNVTDEGEQQRLCETAKALAVLPIDGIVCGFLKGDAIDHELLARVLAAAQPLQVTFHRAFEELSDPLGSIRELKQYPQIDTILTSGGKGSEPEKIACLGVCERFALPEIKILAGGGMTADMIQKLRLHTHLTHFHLGTFVREPQTISGQVSAARVREVLQLIS
ncbi:MAG TPA: copper homeostasis protein CutC [Blastocatellia bacterium]|nr:copper homeostasis protein CutC [Blastocatellia bacterium]